MGAIDLLQDWSEVNRATSAVTDILDFLQLPDRNAVWPPPPDTSKPTPAPARLLWSARAQGFFYADPELPASGGMDLQRRFPLQRARDGATDLLAGVSAGSWLEEDSPYADLELWTGLDLRRAGWDGRMDIWGGWTERNLPEAGISGRWGFKHQWNGWDLRQGPLARISWRRSRFLGWFALASAPVAPGSLELGGSIRARQDPSWPVVLDDVNAPVRFARERIQATFHTALTRARRSWRFGPQVDLDARVSLEPDRWTDSVGPGPKTTTSRSRRRAELGCTAAGFVRWEPSRTWSADGSSGWTWAADAGSAGLELSPFNKGPFLRLGVRTSF